MHIKVPKGSNALYLEHHGLSENSGEHEVLLGRKAKFKHNGTTEHEIVHDHGRNGDNKSLLDYKIIVHHLTHIPGEQNEEI
jgi:hypothetical protein